jgi:hypothetical protein
VGIPLCAGGVVKTQTKAASIANNSSANPAAPNNTGRDLNARHNLSNWFIFRILLQNLLFLKTSLIFLPPGTFHPYQSDFLSGTIQDTS